MNAFNHKQTAHVAFIARMIEIDVMLERLNMLSEEQFRWACDDVDWRHVSKLLRYANFLKQIRDVALIDEEYLE